MGTMIRTPRLRGPLVLCDAAALTTGRDSLVTDQAGNGPYLNRTLRRRLPHRNKVATISQTCCSFAAHHVGYGTGFPAHG